MSTTETPSTVRGSANNLADQGKKSTDNLVDAALAAGDELGTAAKVEFDNIMADLQDLVARASKLSGQELTILRKQISDKLGLAKEKLHNMSEDATAAAAKGVDTTEQMIKDHPLQSVGIAALGGLILGCLMSRR